jgi:hypothetical protein
MPRRVLRSVGISLSITVETSYSPSSHLLEKSQPLSAMELMHMNSLALSLGSIIFEAVTMSSLKDSGLGLVVSARY